MAYCDHYDFGAHHAFGGVAGSFEVVLQRGEGQQPGRHAENSPGIWNGRNALPEASGDDGNGHGEGV